MVCFQFQPFIALPLSHWWGQVMEAQEPSFRSSSRVEEQRLASTSLSRGVSPKMFPPWWETQLSANLSTTTTNLPTTRWSGWWGGSEVKFQDGDASGSWSRSWWAKTQNYSANVQCWKELCLNIRNVFMNVPSRSAFQPDWSQRRLQPHLPAHIPSRPWRWQVNWCERKGALQCHPSPQYVN